MTRVRGPRSKLRRLGLVAIVAVAIPASAAPVPAATPGTQEWVSFSDRKGTAQSVVLSPDGARVYVTGMRNVALNPPDFGTIAYRASDGAQLWVKRYNGPVNRGDGATDVTVSSDGSKLFVTGNSPGSTNTMDIATVAYRASDGAQLWVARYNNAAVNGDEFAKKIAVSPDGSTVFVGGVVAAGSSRDDYLVIAYDMATGVQKWIASYRGYFTDRLVDLGVKPDGTQVFVTGTVLTNASAGYDYATVAFRASDGARQWAKRYNGPVNGEDGDSAAGLAVSHDGSQVFVTGHSWGGSSFNDYATIAYRSTDGAQLWATRFDGPRGGSDAGTDVTSSPDGTRVFVTGISTQTADRSSLSDYQTVAYDAANGAVKWTKRTASRPNTSNYPYRIVVSPDGNNVVVTGTTDEHATDWDPDFFTVAYSASTGSKLWSHRDFGEPYQPAYPNGLAASNARVVVTGQSQELYTTVSYALG
jgi:DNA-binding beta-propeller fold protein YncE